MIATFKETITSLKNLDYGREIIKKPIKSVLWYWTKYLLIFSLIPLILVIFAFTRFLPETPKLINKHLPEGVLGIKDGLMFSTLKQPLVYDFSDSQGESFNFTFDLQASPSAIDTYDNGLLVLKDQVITKSTGGKYQSQKYTSVPDFSVDKEIIADWVNTNRHKLWLVGTLIVILVGVLIIAVTWAFRALAFVGWSLVFLLLNKLVFKKTLSFSNILNLVIYASVLPLFLSLLLTLMPNSFLTLLNTGVFVMYVYLWAKNITQN